MRTNKQYEEIFMKTTHLTTTVATTTTTTTNINSDVNNLNRSLSIYTTEISYDCSQLLLMIDK